MKKVFVVGGDVSYHNMFIELGFTLVESHEDASLVCFTGGADVSPEIYGHKAHPFTGNSPLRDLHESQVFMECRKLGIPMVGICRGGQFLNVMSGGEMYQHVTKHTQSHSITDLETGDVVYVSSTHHQMMKPSEKGFLVASSTLHGEREWWDGAVFAKEESEQDIEVVWYEHTKCLCFQPHPEFNSPDYLGMRRYFADLLNRFIK
jgi:gamma-glutamyl-gamma-aminobutyrate hydrolase PuuD